MRASARKAVWPRADVSSRGIGGRRSPSHLPEHSFGRRPEHGVDDVDRAVGAFDVGLHDLRTLIIAVPSLTSIFADLPSAVLTDCPSSLTTSAAIPRIGQNLQGDRFLVATSEEILVVETAARVAPADEPTEETAPAPRARRSRTRANTSPRVRRRSDDEGVKGRAGPNAFLVRLSVWRAID